MFEEKLYLAPKGVQTRWASPENVWGKKGGGGKASFGRKGSPYFVLRPHRTITLAEVENTSGMVRRIWMTLHDMSPLMLKQLRLEFYWDGETVPAVNVPLGDFFCIGLGRRRAFEASLFANPEGRSFNCFIPMPFRTGMKVTITNDGNSTAIMFFYDIDYTLGDKIPEDALYFHAWYNQELPTTLRKDYTVLDKVNGRGRYLGASFGVFMDKKQYIDSWGGEGEVKIYIDGDTEYPTLCGTGTEDYIGTAWSQGEFSNLYSGCTVADTEKMQLCFYRFHLPDPVYFNEDIRVTIQQIGSWNRELMEHFIKNNLEIYRAGACAEDPPQLADFKDGNLPPFDLFERADYWSSCCYFYLDKPVSGLAAPPNLRERVLSIPDFDMKELEEVRGEPVQVAIIKKYLPNMDELDFEELKELADALNIAVAVLAKQEEALKKDK